MPKSNAGTLISRNSVTLDCGRVNLKHLRIIAFVVLQVVAIVSSPIAGAATDVDVVGETKIVSTSKTVTGGATGSAMQAVRVGPDFHIVAVGLSNNKTVQLELGFAELQKTGIGERIFNLTINEKPALTNFDIVEAAGSPFKSVVKKFSITPQRGFLDFHFTGVIGDAAINYVRITSDDVEKLITPPRPTVLSMAAEEEEYTVPADEQAMYEVETGVINLDKSAETWSSGMPMGGIGTGKFEILPNGQFANFTINNSWDLPVLRPQGTFLAIAAKARSDGGGARLLQVNPSVLSDKNYLKDYPTMDKGQFSGDFPFGTWKMEDDKMPIKAKIDGWSPLVPYNTDDSSIPGAIISVSLTNPKNYPISVGVAFSWEDMNGRGGSLLPNDQHGFSGAATHKDAATSDVAGVQISSDHTRTDREATFVGDYFVGTPIKGATITRRLNWNPRTGSISWWDKFSSEQRLDRIPLDPSSVTAKENSGPMASALCVSFNLRPKETRRVPFIVSWYFPRIVTLDSATGKPSVEMQDYSDRFASSVGVASYLSSHRDDLLKSTAEWYNMIDRATVPQWVKAHTLNSLFPMRSNSIYLKNDRFAMLESPADMKGMLGPVDLRLGAEDFLRSMFPSLDKTELNLFARAQSENGRIPRYVGNIHGALAGFDPELLGNTWVDPTASWILELTSYWRETADKSFIDSLKPAVGKARDYLVSELKSGKAVTAPNVYSVTDSFANSGEMTVVKTLAALRASKELLNDSSAELDSLIFDQLKTVNVSKTTSTFAALMSGEYALRRAGLSGLFDDSTVSEFLSNVLKNNYQHSKPVPLMSADSSGEAPAGSFSYPAPLQSSVGAFALSIGLPKAGLEPYLRMFQIAYGAQKTPWKQALRYNAPTASRASVRYHRSAMSAWSLWRGLSGVVYDLPNKRLYLNPHFLANSPEEMEIPVFTSGFWGWLKYDSVDSTGTLAITRVHGKTTQTLTSVASELTPGGKAENLVTFTGPFVLTEGATLKLSGWPGKGGTVTPMKFLVPEATDTGTTATVGLDDEETSATRTDASNATMTTEMKKKKVEDSEARAASGTEIVPDDKDKE